MLHIDQRGHCYNTRSTPQLSLNLRVAEENALDYISRLSPERLSALLNGITREASEICTDFRFSAWGACN